MMKEAARIGTMPRLANGDRPVLALVEATIHRSCQSLMGANQMACVAAETLRQFLGVACLRAA
jgi:hypothetical protein